MAVKIVTDSTADLPTDLARELDITVVPLNIHFGQESFLDGVDLGSDEFFERLIRGPQLPTTSQPSPGVFADVYRGLVDAGDQVLSIHISELLSGTLNSATQAKGQLGDAPIEVLDSLQVSMGLGLVVTAAAQAAKGGASMAETIQTTRELLPQTQVFALLDTLEYLQRGGRIGKVRAIIGSLLRVRPMITVYDGVPQSLAVVRSRSQGLQRLVDIAEDRAPLKQAAVIYSTNAEEAEELAQRLTPFLSEGRVIKGQFGPVLGTYVGPGAVGIGIQSEKTGHSNRT